ncbi:MAG TPA: efflux RND transporter periplasmic adaptor subunit [Steroidobacteraceae bacterium]|nr:efflux RND transporter periplasmic adaptor subunit [Steroidobacteraceae bacterium]
MSRLIRCVAVSSALLGALARAAEPAAPPPALTVTSASVRSVEIARTITANGSMQAWQDVVIGPEVGGYRVAAVLVDVGDKVRKGQELVRLSADLLEADVATKHASLKEAEAQLIVAAAANRRAESVSSQGVYSVADQEKLRSDELSAQARQESAAADLRAAELRLAYTHVRSPDDGVISSRTVTVGQIAQAGTEMLRLLRQNRVEWHAEVPEARLREIKAGQPVTLTTADGAQLRGKVRTVAPTVEMQRRTGIVYVDIVGGGVARPGMFARGEIEIMRSQSKMVPLQSVVMQDGYSYVFVLGTDRAVARRHVETGTVRGDLIEIVSGIAPGEYVAEKGAGFLKDGDHVIVVAAEEAATAKHAPH